MIAKTDRYHVATNVDLDLYKWLEATCQHENRNRSNLVWVLLQEARAAREANAQNVPCDTAAGSVNALTLEQSKAQGLAK